MYDIGEISLPGADIIRACAASLPELPGVYRMTDASGNVLYVGKARSLKKRVGSYTRTEWLPVRLQRMVSATAGMEFVVTGTEAEALLLEANYIKKLRPRYNILLRDDKSFPYILLTGHQFPRLAKHRGKKTDKGDYYGPFAGARDVNRTLITLQKAFMLRNCTDSYFGARKRPCLQYHIRRCTAPCVGRVCEREYGRQVAEARDFLSGKSRDVQEKIADRMMQASERQDYELAARYRDRLKALSAVQANQVINIAGTKDADVIALARHGENSCIQVFFFRGGQNFGNRSFHMRHDHDAGAGAIISAFIVQFYEGRPVPAELLVSDVPDEATLLEEALAASSGKKIRISRPVRGVRRELVDFAVNNAGEALEREMAGREGNRAAQERLADLFGLDEAPGRIEVYDNSHISGTNMVGAMIVAGPDGFVKNAYRKFNIRSAAAADDYGMMREVMERRFAGPANAEDGDAEDGYDLPDLVLLDGGRGQLSAAMEVLEYSGVADRMAVAAIAKGRERNAGNETFFMPGRKSFKLGPNDPALLYLQSLRDEAHRFAVGSHRARRGKEMTRSPLDEIPGVGAKRKKALLMRFGSAKGVAAAGLKDLEKVEGISKATARAIYSFFRNS